MFSLNEAYVAQMGERSQQHQLQGVARTTKRASTGASHRLYRQARNWLGSQFVAWGEQLQAAQQSQRLQDNLR